MYGYCDIDLDECETCCHHICIKKEESNLYTFSFVDRTAYVMASADVLSAIKVEQKLKLKLHIFTKDSHSIDALQLGLVLCHRAPYWPKGAIISTGSVLTCGT